MGGWIGGRFRCVYNLLRRQPGRLFNLVHFSHAATGGSSQIQYSSYAGPVHFQQVIPIQRFLIPPFEWFKGSSSTPSSLTHRPPAHHEAADLLIHRQPRISYQYVPLPQIYDDFDYSKPITLSYIPTPQSAQPRPLPRGPHHHLYPMSVSRTVPKS